MHFLSILVTKIKESVKQVHDKMLREAEEIEERMRNLEKNREQELKRLQIEVDKKRKLWEKAQELVDQHQVGVTGNMISWLIIYHTTVKENFEFREIYVFTGTATRNLSFEPCCSTMLQNEVWAYWRFEIVLPKID